MIGKNLLNEDYSDVTLQAIKIQRDFICIFISYQSSDKVICREIAKYLMSIDLNVYFDEYDTDLKIANQTANPKAVTAAITKGIEKSTHMLCIISPNTLNSKWVPFEVGYGYDKTNLGILLLKGILKEQLPDYIKASPLIISDIGSLNDFLIKIGPNDLKTKQEFKWHKIAPHPLSNYIEKKI